MRLPSQRWVMARMPKAIPMPMVEELRDVRVNMAVGGVLAMTPWGRFLFILGKAGV